MPLKRTQIYLEPEQHRLLKREAAEKGVSLAELLRQLASAHLRRDPSKCDYARIVGLGKSGQTDGSELHDTYLAQAIRADNDEALR
jgi:hypothetical protein